MYKQQSEQPPKKIVLLSDGTGNSPAKLMKTNVWRMYQAIDLSEGDQIAMYDNGVGTSTFKPLKLLGGGIGFGLKRNVIQLYMFACQNYVPDDARRGRAADEFYLFGFSRGAFTVRVLAGLIADQGLIRGVRGHELERMARWAYRGYRLTFPAKWHVRKVRATLYNAHRAWDRIVHPGAAKIEDVAKVAPRIAFLGLWDTVDAYGLPIDEMTTGWDQWVWPLSLRSRKPLDVVDKICHAVALDDERFSFHPVLYDEASVRLRGDDVPAADAANAANALDKVPRKDVEPALAKHIDEERVTQVWFTGMHSDVGGGYPDDGLAYVPLCWMADQAMRASGGQGLRLFPSVVGEWQAHANPSGPLHDSRQGLAAYYRYKPRSVEALCDDDFVKVRIPRPKIHESVFTRIVAGRDEYAPIVLPERYAVVTDSGAILDGEANPYEQSDEAGARRAGQARVWDTVWLRRGLYFLSVGTSLLLIGVPFLAGTWWPDVFQLRSRGSAGIIDLAAEFLPGFTKPWTQYYRAYPIQLGFLLGVLILLLLASARFEQKIRQRMLGLWDDVLKGAAATESAERNKEGPVSRVRSIFGEHSAFERLTQRLVPPAFGFGALATIVLIGAGALNRGGFTAASVAGAVCRSSEGALDADGRWSPITFSSREPCHATGIGLCKNHRYSVSVALPKGGWTDGSYLVTSPAGFSSLEKRNIAFILGLPFRRLLTARWFVPTARIGASGIAEHQLLDKGTVEFTPRRDGELFLFVNDAVGIWPFTWTLYENNDKDDGDRRATVTITELP